MRTALYWVQSAAACSVLVCASGCGGGGSGGSDISDSAQASTYDPAVPLAWFDLQYDQVKAASTSPPAASRIFGYSSIALYEAVVPGMSDHQTLQGQLQSFPVGTIPTPENEIYHWPTVANRALAVITAHFFPTQQVAIDALEDSLQMPFDAAQPADVITRSQTFGEDVADAVAAWADGDGIAGIAACNAAYVVSVMPVDGGWTPTGPNQGLGALPCWGTLRTFALTDASECPAVGAPAYSELNTSAFYAQALTVYATTGDAGANLTADQNNIAQFWADNAGATGTPGGHWINIVGVIADQENLMLDVVTESYARVGIAIHDAFICCWKTKFDDYLLRPITYIQANIDVNWDPLLGTPGFPTYTSGHSTQSGAAAAVLTAQLGPIAFIDTTETEHNPALGVGDRSFANFLDAANEAAVSRLYGGIHYAFDNQDGFNQGQCIGQLINANVHFLK